MLRSRRYLPAAHGAGCVQSGQCHAHSLCTGVTAAVAGVLLGTHTSCSAFSVPAAQEMLHVMRAAEPWRPPGGRHVADAD